MSGKNDYQPIDSKISDEKKPGKFVWPWAPNEKRVLIIMMILFWGYLFLEFLYMNQQIADQIKGLSDGYFGLKKDTYDNQWNAFDGNLPIILLAAFGHLLGSRLIKSLFVKDKNPTDANPILLSFHLIFGLCYLGYMFEAGLIFWFLLVLANFIFAKLLRSYFFYEPFLWICTLVTLYCNETYHGYKFVWIHPSLSFLDKSVDEAPVHWHVMFNLTILRMMSFCLDYSWASRNKRGLFNQEHEKKCHICSTTVTCYRARQEAHAPISNYNFLNYITFLVYPALFISGPVTTFNAWISQIKTPQNTYSQRQIYKYVLRTFFNYICFQVFLHLFYVCAISTNPANTHLWQKFSLKELGIMSFLELLFLWFKFLLIWRIPRSWALLDGIEVPENMNRCVCNNYTFEGFWRSWHRGFNQWLIRYLFIPLGGSKYKLYNIWAVFSFVALWHDMNLNLVVWAWGICIALMPEMLIKWYFSLPRFKNLWTKMWWKYLCAFAGGLDILLMVSANLVGFGVGWKGLLMVLDNFTNLVGIITLSLGVVGFSVGALIMFWIRENEKDSEKGF